MTQEECPFRSSRVLHDDKGEFHLCNREGGDCECIPSGCPYLIAKNSKLNLPDLPGYVQIDDEQGVCIDSLQVQESCKENAESFTSLEEAAEELFETIEIQEHENIFEDTFKKIFIAGAEWQRVQDEPYMKRNNLELSLMLENARKGGILEGKAEMMKDAVEGEIGYWNQRGLSIRLDQSLEKLGYDEDTKVEVIIKKKD